MTFFSTNRPCQDFDHIFDNLFDLYLGLLSSAVAAFLYVYFIQLRQNVNVGWKLQLMCLALGKGNIC